MSEMHAVRDALRTQGKDKAINDTKIWAMKQRVDYDTFKKMVSVAHLRPLQAPPIQRSELREMPAWELGPDGKRSNSVGHVPRDMTAAGTRPQGSAEFRRDWRRACQSQAQRWAYLQLCCVNGSQGLQAVFRTELDAQLLAEILEAIDGAVRKQTAPDTVSPQLMLQHAAAPSPQLQQDAAADASLAGVHEPTMQRRFSAEAQRHDEVSCVSSSSARECNAIQTEEVVGMLQALAQAGRFGLARQLMPAKGQQAAASIVRWLQQQASQADHAVNSSIRDSLDTLQADYGITADTSLSKSDTC